MPFQALKRVAYSREMTLERLEDSLCKWLDEGATDVLLCEGEIPRVRKNGELRALEVEPLTRADLEILWQACRASVESDRDRDVRYKMRGGDYLRVNLYRAMDRLSAAIRPIKQDIPSLESLGVPADLLRSWTRRSSGIIIVTGATGSGKSTTIASALDDLNRVRKSHIVTLEDPIEYIFTNRESYFSQREITSDTDDFAIALRATLRQNPDVIMVGEIRDEETARMTLRAAETGHLVLTTLHSSGVVETMERLTNFFPPEQRATSLLLLSKQLIGVISQALLPGTDGWLKLVAEYFENQGATRKWIRDGLYREMYDFLSRSETDHTRDLLTGLVAAYHAGDISAEVAQNASPNPGDFQRVIRGIV